MSCHFHQFVDVKIKSSSDFVYYCHSIMSKGLRKHSLIQSFALKETGCQNCNNQRLRKHFGYKQLVEIPQPFHWEVWFILVKINFLLVNILLNLNWSLLYTEMGIASHFLGQSWDWAQFWEDFGLMVRCWDDRLRHRLTSYSISVANGVKFSLASLRNLITKLIFRWKLVFLFWWIDYNKILFTFFCGVFLCHQL